MNDSRDRDRMQNAKRDGTNRKTSDSELDKLAKIEADRFIKKFEKRVLDHIDKEKKKKWD